jgi:predicted phage terminase large subunit-like protein
MPKPPVSAFATRFLRALRGGRDGKGEVHILADLSLAKASPVQWASRAVKAFHEHHADRLVAEVNNGGDLVEALVRQIDPALSYRAVRASRGKMVRAEPVAALYERGLVHHAGYFKELEDELCGFTGSTGDKSPDRLDALVWAVTDLALKGEAEPRIRRF